MAGTMGMGGPGGAPRGRAADAILRHRVVVTVAVLVVIGVLIAVPKQTTSTSTATSTKTSTIVVPKGMTPPNPSYSSGTAVSGVKCGPGVLQVSWSDYAPPCEPAWHGDNGGATARGVTGTTITISYRAASTAQLSELYALVPPTVIGTNTEEEATLQAYINVFNKEFELYGRKVVLKTFQGKGDFIDEDLGEDSSQALEDAVTVADTIKAFADASLVDSSAVYSSDLAHQGVVATSLYENTEKFYATNSPYEYTPGPNCTKSAEATAAVLGKQLNGLPADLTDTPAIDHKTRVYGMIHPANPQATLCATEDVKDLAKFGAKVVKDVGVQFNLAQLINSSNLAVAEMKAAGVTTIILSSGDPITPTFLMQAADKLNYHPEWWFQSYFAGGNTDTDSLANLFPTDQVEHSYGVGNVTEPLTEQEAIKAYKLGAPAGSKPIPSFVFTYMTVLQLFDAIQLAGPDLTPQNFERAMKLIPTSKPGGMLGGWSGKAGPYDPASTYSIVKFTPSITNPLDGKPGAFASCDTDNYYSYAADGSDVPSHKQIACKAINS